LAPDWLARLIRHAREVDGTPPFSDQSLVDYRTGARELVAIDEVAAALATASTDSGTGGVGSGVTEAEFVVDPDARGRGHGTALLETLLSRSAGELLVWAHGDHPAARALAASHGLTPVRELLHLSRYLVGEVSTSSTRSGGSTRSLTSFVVGRDEAAWVALNALIFASHAEQGSVTHSDLEQLETEPWFDAANFLVLRDGEVMIGYCWLKIEGDLGEFYVVGVHPDYQGEKLGSLLFEAGLSRLRELGIHRSHLYVEGDNEPALALYRSRGFEQDSIDIQYRSLSV
jgi:mycothiol synthase